MDEQMIVRLDPDTKEKFARLVRSEGKTSSEVLRDLIQVYVREHDIAAYIDDLWSRIGNTLKRQGATAGDVKKAVKKVRTRKA